MFCSLQLVRRKPTISIVFSESIPTFTWIVDSIRLCDPLTQHFHTYPDSFWWYISHPHPIIECLANHVNLHSTQHCLTDTWPTDYGYSDLPNMVSVHTYTFGMDQYITLMLFRTYTLLVILTHSISALFLIFCIYYSYTLLQSNFPLHLTVENRSETASKFASSLRIVHSSLLVLVSSQLALTQLWLTTTHICSTSPYTTLSSLLLLSGTTEGLT